MALYFINDGKKIVVSSNNVGGGSSGGATYLAGTNIEITAKNVINCTIDLSPYAKKTDLFSKNYNDLTNKPVLFSGSYNDLTDKPTLFSKDYNDLINKPTLFSGSYNDLTDKPVIPTIPTTLSSFTNDTGFITNSALTNYYTKDEINTKLSSAMTYKGSVEKFEDLPTENKIGDLYNVNSDGSNYAWSGSEWDKLSSNVGGIDTSNFATKSDLENYVDLTSEQLITGFKKFGSDNYNYTTMNGNYIQMHNANTNLFVVYIDTDYLGYKKVIYGDVSYKLGFYCMERPTLISNSKNEQMAYLSDIPDTSTFALKTELPTKTSDLTNDSNFITSSALPNMTNYYNKTEIDSKLGDIETLLGAI